MGHRILPRVTLISSYTNAEMTLYWVQLCGDWCGIWPTSLYV